MLKHLIKIPANHVNDFLKSLSDGKEVIIHGIGTFYMSDYDKKMPMPLQDGLKRKYVMKKVKVKTIRYKPSFLGKKVIHT